MKLYDELIWRGLIKDITSEDLIEKLNQGGMTFYIGTDPTADSLHLGHLSSFLISKRLADHGHKPILLVGGATGRIGDPRPTTEREMKSIDEINKNIEAITKQVKKIFGFEVVNNYDWSKDLNFMDFLRDYGKYFNVNYMLDKDIIKRRLETGITYTEFSYMIMQAMDFCHLYETKGCTLQVAGSDQWGNITAGVDLIRKKLGKEAYAFTMPLVTTKDGVKFGKSEGNALWLDKEKTSPYEMYQYLVKAEDEMVISYLKIFTFLTKEEITKLEQSLKDEPEKRLAAKTLAYEVVKFLHGEEEAKNARDKSEAIFQNKGLTDETEEKEINKDEIEKGIKIVDFIMYTDLFPSKSEAKRFVLGNAISLNGNKITNPDEIINESYFKEGYCLVQKGKKNYIKIVVK